MNVKLISNFQIVSFKEQFYPYLAFALATIFFTSKNTYLFLPSLTHKHETKIIKSQNLLITNHPNQLTYVTN